MAPANLYVARVTFEGERDARVLGKCSRRFYIQARLRTREIFVYSFYIQLKHYEEKERERERSYRNILTIFRGKYIIQTIYIPALSKSRPARKIGIYYTYRVIISNFIS